MSSIVPPIRLGYARGSMGRANDTPRTNDEQCLTARTTMSNSGASTARTSDGHHMYSSQHHRNSSNRTYDCTFTNRLDALPECCDRTGTHACSPCRPRTARISHYQDTQPMERATSPASHQRHHQGNYNERFDLPVMKVRCDSLRLRCLPAVESSRFLPQHCSALVQLGFSVVSCSWAPLSHLLATSLPLLFYCFTPDLCHRQRNCNRQSRSRAVRACNRVERNGIATSTTTNSSASLTALAVAHLASLTASQREFLKGSQQHTAAPNPILQAGSRVLREMLAAHRGSAGPSKRSA